ncbi:MAG: histidine kinase [Clostridia bacterium]|nr:histidine kinase [Clostridia bacterium]MBR0415503.1 histidine kinase [Clostridia bacterium]
MIGNYTPETAVLIAVGELFVVILLGFSTALPGVDRISRRYFIAFFSILAAEELILTFDLANMISPKIMALSKVLIFFEYFFISLIPVLLSVFLLKYCGVKLKKSTMFCIVLVIWSAFLILLICAQFTDKIYYLSSDLEFHKGILFPLLLLPILVIMLINLIILIINRYVYTKRIFIAFLIVIVSSAIVTIIYAFSADLAILNISFCLSTLAMYMLIVTEQINKHIQQQADIAHQKANIMVLQMRPHFIYNTMADIYYLCEQNPKEAQQVTLDFITYLRKNFDAIVSENPVPFDDELEHARAYLSVESTRFNENLIVEYNIEHRNFLIPPLTLQPLVENAVRHGLDPNGGRLKIKIETHKTINGSVLIVSDNGPGFDTANAFESAGALSNIKQRLEMMCKGTLTIAPRAGGGTVVTVVIPQ